MIMPTASAELLALPQTARAQSCGSLPSVGCCVQNTLEYCLNGTVEKINCASFQTNGQAGTCGWDSSNGQYACSGLVPAGVVASGPRAPPPLAVPRAAP